MIEQQQEEHDDESYGIKQETENNPKVLELSQVVEWIDKHDQ
jgi:hypothetical protein